MVKADLFPPEARLLGAGLPYAVSQSLFGGSAETVALSLRQAGYESGYFWYVTLMIGFTLIATIVMRETRPQRD